MQRMRAGVNLSVMEDEMASVTEDFNRTLFRGCPAGSLELAGELTERSLGYPLSVMTMLYYECGDGLAVPDPAAENEGVRHS